MTSANMRAKKSKLQLFYELSAGRKKRFKVLHRRQARKNRNNTMPIDSHANYGSLSLQFIFAFIFAYISKLVMACGTHGMCYRGFRVRNILVKIHPRPPFQTSPAGQFGFRNGLVCEILDSLRLHFRIWFSLGIKHNDSGRLGTKMNYS